MSSENEALRLLVGKLFPVVLKVTDPPLLVQKFVDLSFEDLNSKRLDSLPFNAEQLKCLSATHTVFLALVHE